MTSYHRYFFLLFVLSGMLVSCKHDTVDPEVKLFGAYIDGELKQVVLDRAPEYIDGGNEGLARNTLTEVKYPAEARENGIEGQARIQFDVLTSGETDNFAILQDPGTGCGQAALEGIMSATEGMSFLPGIYQGSVVTVRMEMRVVFRLE